MYVVNSFNVCGKSVSVFSTSTVYTVNPRFAFIRGGRFILSLRVLIIMVRPYVSFVPRIWLICRKIVCKIDKIHI